MVPAAESPKCKAECELCGLYALLQHFSVHFLCCILHIMAARNRDQGIVHIYIWLDALQLHSLVNLKRSLHSKSGSQ